MTAERTMLWVTMLLTMVGTVLLAGPGIWGAHDLPAGAFHPGHPFFAWHLSTVPAGGVLSHPPFGWPGSPSGQMIGGVPLAVAAALQWIGPMRAYGVALVVGPLLTAVTTWGWLKRCSDGTMGARAAGTLAMVFCSFAIAALGNGQFAKMQLWVIPSTLWTLDLFVDRPHVRTAVPLLGVTILGVLTAPSIAVQLPVAGALQLLLTETSRGVRARLTGLALLGVGMLPGLLFLSADPSSGTRPAVAGAGLRLRGAPPSASLDDLLFGVGVRANGLDAINHAPVLALAGLGVGIWLALRAGRGRRLGLGLLFVGAALALGPVLRWDGDPVSIGSWTVSMPASWMAALGYPMGRTGQWYRFVVVASLGLALLLSRAPTRRATLGAVLAVALGVVQAVSQSGHVFPRPAVPVPAAASMERLRDSTTPGAVVVLPHIASPADVAMGMAMGALARRHTTAMACHTEGHASTVALRALVQQAQSARSVEKAHRVLAEAGVAVVVWRPDSAVIRGEVWLDEAAVSQALGPPEVDAGTSVWWVNAKP
ncbi:MAG: hypothetical protein CL927_18140 [Deltaproteobacteria bacterium]|nr:hypothetical protein [Deltaproteobacteria bacterium]HCH61351.1 hypothetical protein [Deltaproteobacteria bacterium]